MDEPAVSLLLEGPHNSIEARIIKAKFDVAVANNIIEQTVAYLTAKIRELSLASKSLKTVTMVRRCTRYKRRSGLDTISDYACMTHKVDNHKECHGSLIRWENRSSKLHDQN